MKGTPGAQDRTDKAARSEGRGRCRRQGTDLAGLPRGWKVVEVYAFDFSFPMSKQQCEDRAKNRRETTGKTYVSLVNSTTVAKMQLQFTFLLNASATTLALPGW